MIQELGYKAYLIWNFIFVGVFSWIFIVSICDFLHSLMCNIGHVWNITFLSPPPPLQVGSWMLIETAEEIGQCLPFREWIMTVFVYARNIDNAVNSVDILTGMKGIEGVAINWSIRWWYIIPYIHHRQGISVDFWYHLLKSSLLSSPNYGKTLQTYANGAVS